MAADDARGKTRPLGVPIHTVCATEQAVWLVGMYGAILVQHRH